jgi:hypothetical protein
MGIAILVAGGANDLACLVARRSRLRRAVTRSFESKRTPGSPTWQATNSLATRFIPSRKGVTSATSASR